LPVGAVEACAIHTGAWRSATGQSGRLSNARCHVGFTPDSGRMAAKRDDTPSGRLAVARYRAPFLRCCHSWPVHLPLSMGTLSGIIPRGCRCSVPHHPHCRAQTNTRRTAGRRSSARKTRTSRTASSRPTIGEARSMRWRIPQVEFCERRAAGSPHHARQ